VAAREVALVAPPEGHTGPVDRTTVLVVSNRCEHGFAHTTTGEHDVRLGLLGERLAHALDESGRHRGGQALLVVVDTNASLAHGHFPSAAAPAADASSSASPF